MTDKVEANKDKWNQIIFENANKNHLHQDNLRWGLSGGFGALFYGGMNIITNKQVADQHLAHYIQLALILIGTAYFFIILIEGWYYNLYLAHLIQCEKDVANGTDLTPFSSFDRSNVDAFHPSFLFVLFLICVANTFHLLEFLLEDFGSRAAIAFCIFYIVFFMGVAIRGRVPQIFDATLDKRDRKRRNAARRR